MDFYCHPSTYPAVPYRLYRNLGNGKFADVTEKSGFAKALGKGMGNCIADFNDDGWTDVFIANDTEPNFFYLNQGDGTFREVGLPYGVAYDDAGMTVSAMGCDAGDYDNDGWQHLMVTSLGQRPRILINSGESGRHWLLVELRGRRSNRDAIGARVKLTTASGPRLPDHVSTSVGFMSSSDPRVHFGPGADDGIASIEARRPSGAVRTLENVKAGPILRIEEPEE